jgi:hypothetical protein
VQRPGRDAVAALLLDLLGRDLLEALAALVHQARAQLKGEACGQGPGGGCGAGRAAAWVRMGRAAGGAPAVRTAGGGVKSRGGGRLLAGTEPDAPPPPGVQSPTIPLSFASLELKRGGSHTRARARAGARPLTGLHGGLPRALLGGAAAAGSVDGGPELAHHDEGVAAWRRRRRVTGRGRRRAVGVKTMPWGPALLRLCHASETTNSKKSNPAPRYPRQGEGQSQQKSRVPIAKERGTHRKV